MVRPTKGAILGYKPEPPPTDLPASAQRYLDQELHRIAGVLQGVLAKITPGESLAELQAKVDTLTTVIRSNTVLMLAPTMEEPPDPGPGELIYVDGTGWDPGSGKGYYYWNGAVWAPLG